MAELQFGKVRGQYLLIKGTKPRAATGRVTFTPIEPDEIVDGPKVTTREKTVAVFDANGWLHLDEVPVQYVQLAVGRWEVSFREAPGLTVKAFQFDVTPTGDGYIDLPALAPITPGPAVKFVVNEAVYTETLEARDEAIEAVASVQRGEPDGVASLDGDGVVPEAQLPDRLSASSIAETVGDTIGEVKGAAGGLASLDGNGDVPDAQLPTRLSPEGLLGTFGAVAVAGSDEVRDRIVSVVAPNYQRLERMLEGVPLTVYGDSQAKNPSQGADTGTQFSDRLNGRQRFRSYDNRGVAGTTMGEIASAVASSWAANARGLVLVCSGIGNTSTLYGADGQASAARAFRAIMAVLSSRARFPFSSTTFAFDASWAAGTSSTVNSVFDVGVNGDTAYLLVNTATGAGGVIEIRDGSRLITTIDTGNHKAVFPGAFKLSGLGTGDHILRGKLVSGTATVVGLVIPSATPAQVAWVTVEPSRANVAQRQSYVDACAAVLADFPGVVRVTPGTDWDPLLHISDEDGLHLNDRGNAYMADRIETVLASTIDFSQGLNRLTRSTAAAAYVGPIPTPLVVVTTYASDSFDRANGALGSTEVGNKAWTLSVASSVAIVDNAAEWSSASATAGTIAYVDDAQQLGKFTAEGINAQSFGLFACGDASLNGYYFFHSNSNGWRIGIRTPSGFTALATAGSTTPPSTAVTIALVRGAGGALTGFVDGSPIVSATDTTYAGTRHGIISLLSGRRVTAWRHTDL